MCACEACWAMRSGEGDYRPTGNRTLWLPGLDVPDDLWASFQIPIGLAFFMESTVTGVRGRDVPEPGRGDRVGAPLRFVDADAVAQPGARQPRAGHRGPDRQSPGRSADVRDRADRSLLRAHRHDQGPLGGDLRGPGRPGRGRALLRRASARRRPPVRRTRRRCRPRLRGARRAPGQVRRRPDADARPSDHRDRRPRGVYGRPDASS